MVGRSLAQPHRRHRRTARRDQAAALKPLGPHEPGGTVAPCLTAVWQTPHPLWAPTHVPTREWLRRWRCSGWMFGMDGRPPASPVTVSSSLEDRHARAAEEEQGMSALFDTVVKGVAP